MHAPTIYWEDLQAGQVRELGQVCPSAEEIREFAEKFDPQPFHLDEQAARASLFGGLCASGWHTCAMTMRLMVDNFLRHAASLGSPGLDSLKWLKPVHAGDTLRLRQTVLETRPMNSKPDVGLTRSTWELFNQHGEAVLYMEGWGMFRRRPAGAVAATPGPTLGATPGAASAAATPLPAASSTPARTAGQ